MATFADVLEAVKDAVVALELPASVERAYLPRVVRAELRGKRIIVAPASWATARVARKIRRRTCEVDVALYAPYEAGLAIPDECLALLATVADALEGARLAAANAYCTAARTLPAAEAGYSPEKLDTERMVLCVLRLTYELDESC